MKVPVTRKMFSEKNQKLKAQLSCTIRQKDQFEQKENSCLLVAPPHLAYDPGVVLY